MTGLTSRVDVGFIGNGNTNDVFGGYLNAWSFTDRDPLEWYNGFRSDILNAIGKKHLPIYRMADGEFRFLMGRRINWHKRPLLRELAGYLGEVSGIRGEWRTSWGEAYSSTQREKDRGRLVKLVSEVASQGFLAPYIYDNGIHAFEEHNKYVAPFFASHNIRFENENYVPFHFPVNLLVDSGSREFFEGRHILLVTHFRNDELKQAKSTLNRLRVRRVSYIEISPDGALNDQIQLDNVYGPIDLCLVAAGIGSANILTQLAPLNTVAMDIGSFMRSLVDNTFRSHCVFRVPAA